MNFFILLFSNEIFTAAALSWFVAQVIKTILYAILNKKLDLERMVGSGGMPSSHSSTVTALATASFFNYGADSFEFAITAVLAMIVMYDARGVRREAGKQAKVLNDLLELFADTKNKIMPIDEKLKEFVGHTPLQVCIGGILGVIIASLLHFQVVF
ncbi:MAG: divergent PAP2 family protein [Lachnospiraceae bacterium]